MPAVLYAAIMAQATNLGLTGMARASEFSYQQLEWATEQLPARGDPDRRERRPGRLPPRPLAHRRWGTGRLSSSDGQRFASPHPRARDSGAAAVLRAPPPRPADLLVDLRPIQPVRQQGRRRHRPRRDPHARRDPRQPDGAAVEEHTTDTHGYTEMIFGVFDLLGLRFAPRIRDLDRQRLYRYGTPPAVGHRRAAQTQDPPRAHPPVLGRATAPRSVSTSRVGARLAAARPPAGRLAAQPTRPSPAGVRTADQDQLHPRVARRRGTPQRGSAASSTKASSSTRCDARSSTPTKATSANAPPNSRANRRSASRSSSTRSSSGTPSTPSASSTSSAPQAN